MSVKSYVWRVLSIIVQLHNFHFLIGIFLQCFWILERVTKEGQALKKPIVVHFSEIYYWFFIRYFLGEQRGAAWWYNAMHCGMKMLNLFINTFIIILTLFDKSQKLPWLVRKKIKIINFWKSSESSESFEHIFPQRDIERL